MRTARAAWFVFTYQKTHEGIIVLFLHSEHLTHRVSLDRVYQRLGDRLAGIVPFFQSGSKNVIVAAVDADGHAAAPSADQPNVFDHHIDGNLGIVLAKRIQIDRNIIGAI